MRNMLKVAAIFGGLSVSLVSTSAIAGGCGYGMSGPNCAPNVVTHPGGSPGIDPMHVYSEAPMGHLRSVQFLGTPSVNITRIHGMAGAANLSDAPTSFTNSCTPESTQYCRQGGAVAPAPVMARPAPVIAQPAPVIAQPAPVAERVVYVGKGYDPSKFIPRTYGSNELTPGIAHIPTSIVDRSHANATAVLNSGRTQPQPIASGGVVPHPSMVSRGNIGPAIVSQGSIAPVAPRMGMQMGMMARGNVIGMVNQTVRMAPQTNVYPGSMAADGTYYEKVSGPTKLGSTIATQIICKRQAPSVNVQRPVIGVPHPVPTPMFTQCAPAPIHAMPNLPQQRFGSSRYGH